MPSPFPGMDPFLEGPLWPDVHQALASKIREQLAPQLRPKYVARLAIAVIADRSPQLAVDVMYPDVEVIDSPRRISESQAVFVTTPVEAAADLSAPLKLRLPSIDVKVVRVRVRDAASNRLVTSIEILSPANKREPLFSDYLNKCERLRRHGVHLLEIDLIRRGIRPLEDPQISGVPYLMTLTRAGSAIAEVWPVKLADKLPLLPVPLREPDPDARLDLSAALSTIYDEAGYDLSIDYHKSPPPPPLAPADLAWMQVLLTATS